MRRLSAASALTLATVLSGCWGPIDKGHPGVGTRITPQGHGAEWIKLKTELDGKSPVAAAPAGHGEAAGHGAAPAGHAEGEAPPAAASGAPAAH